MIDELKMLRCPLAGSSSVDIRRCPGFVAGPVPAGDVDGTGRAYVTCDHLSAESDDRGFFPACHHPEAAWIVDAAALLKLGAEVRGAAQPRTGGLAERVSAAHAAAAYAAGRARMLIHVSRDLCDRSPSAKATRPQQLPEVSAP